MIVTKSKLFSVFLHNKNVMANLDYVELKNLDEKNDFISKEYLYNIHQQQRSNGITNENHTVEIINILGGVHTIKSTCSSIDIECNNIQFKSLDEEPNVYAFKKYETILHCCLKESTANKIIAIIYNKCTASFVIGFHIVQ